MARKAVGKKKTLTRSKQKPGKKSAKSRKKKVLAIPKRYRNLTSYLIVDNADKAIEFYQKAFAAKLLKRIEHPGGKVGHAELKIGDTMIMLADEFPKMNAHSPKTYGGSPVSFHLYCKNVDKTVAKALTAGAMIIRPIENMFFGDRCGTVVDPFGHRWHIATHIEDLSPAMIKKRAAAFFKQK